MSHNTTFCRHCLEDMYIAGIQEYPAKYNFKPITYIECHNPGCPLWMHTFDKDTYAVLDLTPYLKGTSVK